METDVIKALMPAFAAGFANQRLMEIFDPVLVKIGGEERKRIYLGILSAVVGVGFALGGGLRALKYLGAESTNVWFPALDIIITGLIISAGTDGFNSILKFLTYKKEESKATAAAEKISVSKFLTRRGATLESFLREDLEAVADFTPGEAMLIAYKSVTTTTGSAEPITPTATLAKYGAQDPDIPTVRNKVINNAEYGLRYYGRTMNPNALKDLTNSWTLQQLADITFEESM